MIDDKKSRIDKFIEAFKEAKPLLEWMKDISSVIGSVHTEDIKEWLKKWENLK